MNILRRSLGVFVMVAGIIGLLLSLTGLIGVGIARSVLTTTINSTIDTLISSIDTSQRTLDISYDALEATTDSINTLSAMLDSTAVTIEDTQPVIDQVSNLMAKELPDTIATATKSLDAAEQAAQSLESAIKSFETFQMLLGSNPLSSGLIPAPSEPYNPETSLANSLSGLSDSMQDLPDEFKEMAVSLEKTDENLVLVTDNMELMSQNVLLISDSLGQYQTMIEESKTSTEALEGLLTNFNNNLPRIMNITTVLLVLFFLWLLAAQVVIISQGYELFHGTAANMASESVVNETENNKISPTKNEQKNENLAIMTMTEEIMKFTLDTKLGTLLDCIIQKVN
ncbi:MAG: hypothetical protein K0B14_09350 [Anaerolineaceae bacterium]|nr:hypothetical protein [Anaerolineaceae bacterium]